MSGYSICFYEEIYIIIAKLSLLCLYPSYAFLSGALILNVGIEIPEKTENQIRLQFRDLTDFSNIEVLGVCY